MNAPRIILLDYIPSPRAAPPAGGLLRNKNLASAGGRLFSVFISKKMSQQHTTQKALDSSINTERALPFAELDQSFDLHHTRPERNIIAP